MSPDDLDETIEESFPASDAPANTPETGIGIVPEDGDEDDEDDASVLGEGVVRKTV
jgi:hypothetical protein